MLSIAVVDDEQAHRDILIKYIEEWRKKERLDVRVDAFESSEAFYFMWCGDQRCDVLFLDIMMGGADGVSLAKKLRETGRAITIIFTTGIADYMQEGFEVEAMHYLLKPLDREKVWECLDKCLKRKGSGARTLLLPGEEGLVKIGADGLFYAEAEERSCVLAYRGEKIWVKTGIRELAKELGEDEGFVFCHRSCLVNVRKIAKVGRTELALDDGTVLPVSRRQYREVNERFIRTVVGRQP